MRTAIAVRSGGAFAYAVKKDLSVPMDDGVVLSVDEYFPVDPTSGARAAGHFPVLLEQTAYGKDRWAESVVRDVRYFVERGYIVVVADLRGNGKSRGQAVECYSETCPLTPSHGPTTADKI